MALTICTPTYNRAYILERLYKSLNDQTNNDFVWCIVDDGSVDGTRDLVESWKNNKDNKVDIQYIYQENAGEMQALNTGIDHTNTELFLFVDSDDWMCSTAVEDILTCWEETKNEPIEKNICGIIAYHGEDEFTKYGGIDLPTNKKYVKLMETWDKGYKYTLALVFRTEVIKRFKFPYFEGEKFITEKYIYDQIDQQYQYIVLNRIVQVKEFREDGLSADIIRIHLRNPKGMACFYNQGTVMHKRLSERIRDAANYVCYSKVARSTDIISKASSKLLVICFYPIGYYLYKKRIRSIGL